jgi:hypothetical protein
MKTFIENNWHRHALLILLTTLFMWGFSQSEDDWWYTTFWGYLFSAVISTMVGSAIAAVIEWGQSVFMGAHKGKEGVKASNMDWVASTILAAIGTILFFIFNEITLIIITLVFVGACEIYKQSNKKDE